MAREDNDFIEALIRKLERFGPVNAEDKAALRAIRYSMEQVPLGHRLVSEGGRTTGCAILASGFACRHKSTGGGGRQIVSFHIPGDVLDLQHLLFSHADHSIQTITSARVAWVPYRDMLALIRERPAINEAFWRETLVEASIFREWILNVGRRDARSRIAHLICEFVARCEASGVGPADRFKLPMTQEEIADATGLTTVHVNRMLQALRQAGAIAGSGAHMEITDWELLKHVADFDSAYLHLAA